MMKIEDLHWHDGNIVSLELVPGTNSEAEVHIQAELYDDSVRTPGRDAFRIQCIGVSRFTAVCDMKEIARNSEFGSINGCSMKRKTLRLKLFEGYIEIRANEFRWEKC